MKLSRFLILLMFVLSAGCASLVTKEAAFPGMYQDMRPNALVVVPAINNTTSADAPNYLNVTVTQPLADAGYYVLPMQIVSGIFENEGIVDGAQLESIPPQVFKKSFGADAVLFITINKWDKNYYVIAGNVKIGLDYLMLSTETGETLWSYTGEVVMDTSGSSSSGNLLADLIVNTVSTAISTAATRYVSVASMVHAQVLTTLPLGEYHPKSGEDRDSKVVDLKKVRANE